VRRPGQALVEHHGDVGPERGLDVNRRFGRKEVRTAIEMRLEVNAFFSDFAAAGETEDLIAAAVRQNSRVPADKAVESAESRDQSLAGRRWRW
jgi:ribosomal protein L39E